jgi:subtilisin family serine protease
MSRTPRRNPRGTPSLLLRLITALLMVGTLFVVGTATQAAAAPEPNAADKIKPKLAKQLDAKGEATFWVRFDQADLSAATQIKDWDKRGQAVFDALTAKADASQSETRALLDSQKVKYQSFYGTNAIRVESGDGELALRIARSPDVESLWPTFDYDLEKPTKGKDVREVNAVEWGIANINADDVWDQYGVAGEGLVIANIDTGVQFDHPALVDQYRGNNGDGTFDHNYNWFNAAGSCANAPCDTNGHGTHTMGTMLGDDGGSNQIGVAPGATWIAANGCCPSDAALIASGEWMLAPRDLTDAIETADPSKRPNIINNSWGSTLPSNDPFMEDIQLAWAAAGIWGQWSNGNSGPSCQTSGSPGSRIINYSAGAYDINNNIASFSGRGTGQDGEIKPNISAPGVNVRSSLPGGSYGAFNGTSMASPHVAGTVALLWSAAPSLMGDIEGTRALLDGSAVDTEDAQCGGTADDNNVYGEGRLDALALLSSAPVGDTGTIAGTVSAANGDPIGGATVTVDGEFDRSVTTDADGTYSVRVAVGDYQVSASAFGYLPSAPVAASVTADATTTVNIALEAAPSHTVSGTVTDLVSGEPYAGVTVSLSGPIDPVTTDPAGAFAFADVPEGTYTLSIAGGSCTSPFSQEVVVDGDESVNAQITRRFDDFGYFCGVGNAGVRSGDTQVALTGDDQATTVEMPFSFPFYEGEFSTAYVTTNGHVNFTARSTSLANTALPNPAAPHAAIYPMWDDLYFDATSALYTATTQVDGVDAFVLEWRDVTFYANRDERTNFSVTLLANGEFEIGYGDNTGGALAAGSSATIGIENENSTVAHQYSFNTQVVTPGLSIRYDSAPRGSVTGTVTDLNTGDPVAGASVTVANEVQSKTVDTGADGTYSTSVLTGDYSVEVSADGYESATGSVTVTEDAATTFDAALAAGMVTIESDGNTHADLRMGQSHVEELTVTNEGTAPASVELAAGGGQFEQLGTGALRSVEGKATVPASLTPKGQLSADGPSMSRSGAKGKTVTPQAAPIPHDEVTITHSASQEIASGNSASCNNGLVTQDNGYLRTFTLDDFGLNGLDVSSVSFGVESNDGSQPLTVNLYTLDGELTYANMTPIGSADFTVPSGDAQMVTVPVEGTVPSGGTLVVEVDVPAGGWFFIGSNGAGQTAPSYIRSATCGIAEPADTSSIGFPDMHIVMNVTGSSGAPADWVSFDNPSFTLEPGESTTVRATLSADVAQPGAYSAEVGATTDTPYSVPEVPVSMNVSAPRSWGKVMGTVTSADGEPLGGAVVQVNGGKGYRTTLITEDDGTYAYWVDSKVSPLQLVVSLEGYVPATAKVSLKAGQTVRKDFSLDPLP